MRIRTATPDDAPALQRYAIALFAEDLPGIFSLPAPTLEDERAFILSALEPPNSTLLLAEEDGEVIGAADFRGAARPRQAHGGEFGISVAREHRGRGVGTALIQALIAWAREAGIRRIEVHAHSNNPRALALYRRLGFEDEGLLRENVTWRGEYHDTHVLSMLL